MFSSYSRVLAPHAPRDPEWSHKVIVVTVEADMTLGDGDEQRHVKAELDTWDTRARHTSWTHVLDTRAEHTCWTHVLDISQNNVIRLRGPSNEATTFVSTCQHSVCVCV